MSTDRPAPKDKKRRALGRGLSALLPSQPAKPSPHPHKTTVSEAVGTQDFNPLDSRPDSTRTKPALVEATANKKQISKPKAEPLAAIAPASSASMSKPSPATENTGEKRVYFKASVEEIFPSPEQPRRRFQESELGELAQSIKNYGIIQPLIVRKRPEGGYFLIAGERRWRASQRAGVTQVPIVVKDVTPNEAFEQAIVENVQRADLNIIEEAEAYQRLLEEHELTQEEVAGKVGKDRSTVANAVRLLKLPPSVRSLVESRSLSMGHARALLALPSATEIEKYARMVVSKGLSVRAIEELIRRKLNPPAPMPTRPEKSASVRDVENKLVKALGTQVGLQEAKRGQGGCIEIRYSDLDELDRLLEHLLREA